MSSSSVSSEKVLAESKEVKSYLGLRGRKLNLAVSIIAGIGFLLFGYDQGVMGSLLTLPSFGDTFRSIRYDSEAPGESHRSLIRGTVIALYEIGCMTTSLLTIYLGDKLGRLRIIFLGAAIMALGGALQACAYTVAHLTVARIVTGFGNGFITSTVPVWQAEISRAHMRGKSIMIEGSLIALGITIAYWIDFAFYFVKGSDVDWRFPVAFQCIFPIMIMPVILKLPESPRWLMARGREDEARDTFSALYDIPPQDTVVTVQLDEIRESIELERQGGAENFKLKDLFSQGESRNFHRACLAFCSQMMQQISGINLITYYAGTIFEEYIGISATKSRILAACNGTEYFLASLLGFITIERFGRRILLIWGAVGMSVTMAILTGANWAADEYKGTSKGTNAGIASAVFLFVFNTCFGITYLGGTWLLPPELLPLQIRAPGAALSTAANWAFNFVVVMITPVAFDSIGPYTYTIFAAINFLMVPTVYFLYPETAGRSLEEMDLIFNKTPVSQPWKVVKIARELPSMKKEGLTTDQKREAFATHKENVADEEASELFDHN